MKRYKIFTSLSTVSNNEITTKSNEEMATAYRRFYSNMHIIKYALVFFWLRSSCKPTILKKPQPITNVIVSLVLR